MEHTYISNSDDPNSVFGSCPAEYQATITASVSTRMMGEMENFFATITAAVHKHNREAQKDDFVGLSYPQYDNRRSGISKLGNSVVIVGSKKALEGILESQRLKNFVNQKEKTKIMGFTKVLVSPENPSFFFTRSRTNERLSLGDIKRRIRRAEKNGKPTKYLEEKMKFFLNGESREDSTYQKNFIPETFFKLGDKNISIKANSVSQHTHGKVRVSTYGLSDKSSPLVVSIIGQEIYDNALFED